MIAFDFEYYEATTLKEAKELYEKAQAMDKKVMYYNGGTEFITFARKGKAYAEVVINIKNIPDCNLLEVRDGTLLIGASVTLNAIVNAGFYPLLEDVVKRIADHTSRNKITIGGNLNSQLMYKEAILPLLLADAKLEIFGEEGIRYVPVQEVFNKKRTLKQGELLVTIQVATENLQLPSTFIKRTKMSKVGYPVVSAAAIIKEEQFRIAFSGVCASPFRSAAIEKILNASDLQIDQRIEKALREIPGKIVEDVNGSSAYRQFLLTQVMEDMYRGLEVGK